MRIQDVVYRAERKGLLLSEAEKEALLNFDWGVLDCFEGFFYLERNDLLEQVKKGKCRIWQNGKISFNPPKNSSQFYGVTKNSLGRFFVIPK